MTSSLFHGVRHGYHAVSRLFGGLRCAFRIQDTPEEAAARVKRLIRSRFDAVLTLEPLPCAVTVSSQELDQEEAPPCVAHS